ncbi:GGDEF domain-containing protein [Sulfurospirillum diekertiae]|uniref:diguanylate cyclase n=1 Tax=Sulfurospirillum diekertiae TaxID=1854492 RepID=A0A1Y0HMY4_9BACT|nr:GGDEF domain-containing protein [Sulfurospirillum diekertiae]ARU48936.1 putative diguanylate cyclase AdrA [Sulfurospirillum diekertiae]ASC93755.1 putative diguanylate cyclase AdrA [Sulfurospirillum diekertiae]
MKRIPRILLKKPILLGSITFVVNLVISMSPVLYLHGKHVAHYKSIPSFNTQLLIEEQDIVYSALFYSFIFAFIISILITFLAFFLKKSYLEVENLSHFDGLTGLYNRLMFMSVFQKEIQKVKRNRDYLFLVILDIDDFKPINDTYGHLIGDEAIKITASTLQQLLRASESIARFGGDEFIISIVDQDKNAASTIVNRILNEFNNKTIPVSRNHDQQELQINLSIGYTLYRNDDDFKTMLQRADQALYISKEAGKNTATFLA